MRNPERGASQVSVLWLILVMLVALAMAVTAWVQSTSLTTSQKEVADLKRSVSEKESLVDQIRQRYRAVSGKVGWMGEGSPETEITALDPSLTEAAKALGGGATLQDVMKSAQGELTKAKGEIETLKQQITALQSEVKTASEARDAARTALQQQLDELDRRTKDQQASDAARIAALDTQVNEKTKAAKDATDRATAIQEEKDKEVSKRQKDLDLVTAKNADLNTKLAFQRTPDEPKGSIVEVSTALPIGYVDLGKGSRVQPGTRFQVVDFNTQHKYRVKGWAEVTRVDEGMSEVRLEGQSSMSPIVKGDKLLNPLFDPKGLRKAVLVGRFPLSAGGKQGVETRLKDLGIQIAEKVDAGTDYVIVGAPEISNAGEVQDLETHPEIVSATKFGTLRYTLRDLEGFFRRS